MSAAKAEALWRAKIIAEARSWCGVKYLHQAASKEAGCDCLGLVRGVWRKLIGPEPETIPHYSSDWAEIDGFETLLEAGSRHFKTVAIADAKPGDVLVFRWQPDMPAKHCGILVEQGRMVHAYQSAGIVAESNISQWRSKIAGAFAFPNPATNLAKTGGK